MFKYHVDKAAVFDNGAQILKRPKFEELFKNVDFQKTLVLIPSISVWVNT